MATDKIDKSYPKMPGFGRGGTGGRRFGQAVKPKDARKTLQRLLKILLLWRKPLLLAVALTLVAGWVVLLIPYLLGQAINTFQIETNVVNRPLLMSLLMALAASYLAVWFIETFNGVMIVRITQKLIKHMRTEFFAKLQRIPLNFYDTRVHGDTMSRITNDIDTISNTISQTTTHLITSVFNILGALVMMMILSPPLTAVAMVSIPLFFGLTRTIARQSRKYFSGQQQKLGSLNGMIEENILGIKIVKAFNRQENVMRSFSQLNRELRDNAVKAQIWSGFLMPFMNVINNISFALIVWAGGILAVQGMISVGVVVSFISYSKLFASPLNHIAGMFSNLQSALAGAERVFEILDEAEETPDKIGVRELVQPRGEVEFREVSFSYQAGIPILQDVSFKVSPGEVVALVGETGAGKTTIVNLLTRFYEVDEGQILIDGRDITDIARQSLRNCFSVVLQDTCLFTGTIYDNIRYAKPTASEEEVKEAARLSRADEFISRLPKGYETMISGSADSLSQGQKQLLAIARALLGDAPILILDEATSSVDTMTEKAIQQAMLELMKNHTSFLIAHRLSTIRDADKILLIGGGRIMEAGTHQELMELKGAYYQMVLSQLGIDE